MKGVECERTCAREQWEQGIDAMLCAALQLLTSPYREIDFVLGIQASTQQRKWGTLPRRPALD
jgi:hypothetical protein